jgi:hypothetical protein
MTYDAVNNALDAAKNPAGFKLADLAYALDNAAEFLEHEEWPERDGGQQVAANKEAAKRIRKMATRQWRLAARADAIAAALSAVANRTLNSNPLKS